MILKAMKELHVGKHIRLGITAVAVGNYIRTNYPVKENYRRFLRVAFQKALEEGLLTRDGVYYRTTRKARSRIRTKPRYNRKRKSSDSKSSVLSKRSKKVKLIILRSENPTKEPRKILWYLPRESITRSKIQVKGLKR